MRSRARRLAVVSLLSALAVAVGAAESLFPLPFPGVRLGAANVFPLLALLLLGAREAVTVAALRLCLSFFLAGNPFALACSAGGLALSLPLSIALYCKFRETLSVQAISVASAEAFNLGQIAVVVALTSEPAILAYAPVILAVGAATGAAVGFVANKMNDRLKKTLSDRI